MGCWPKNGLLDMNKGLSLQHIGRPHSGIGQSLHKFPLAACSVPSLHASVPWQTEGFPVSFSSPTLWKVLITGWREESRRLEGGGQSGDVMVWGK